MFIDVDCRHPEAILTPMPEGLSQQQVGLGAGRARQGYADLSVRLAPGLPVLKYVRCPRCVVVSARGRSASF